MKWPLLPVALLYAAGVALAHFLELSILGLFTAAFLLAAVALCWTRLRPLLLVPLIFLAGACHLTWKTAILSPQELRQLIPAPLPQAVLRGSLRQLRVRERAHEDTVQTNTQALVEVDALRPRADADWEPAEGLLLTVTPGTFSRDFFPGQRVEFHGTVANPPGPLAPGLFDYENYLREKGVYFLARVSSTNQWRLLSKPPFHQPWPVRFRNWAKATLALGLPEEDMAVGLRWAMTLGWKTGLTDEVSEPFMRSGTMHIFAISGLHIALVSIILVGLLRVFKLSRAACAVCILPLIWFYTAATGWQSSAIRSSVMTSVVMVGWMLERPGELPNSLAAAALLLLCWDPRQLFQAGFQLSFLVVLSIALLLPPLEKQLQRIWRKDPLLPDDLRPWWQHQLEKLYAYLQLSFATSLAAWLGSLLLVAYYFHLFTPVSLLANLVIIPLSSLVLMSGVGSLITGAWFPACTVLFNHAGWFFMTVLIRVAQWAADLPFSHRYVPAPGWLALLLYYTLLFAGLTGWIWKVRFRHWIAGACCLLGLAWVAQWENWREQIRLTVLPMNGGAAVHFHQGTQAEWLVDCGDVEPAENVLVPYLHGQGVNRLSNVLLSHGDQHQVGGLFALDEAIPVSEIAMSPVPFRSPVYRRHRRQLEEESPSRLRFVTAGQSIWNCVLVHPGGHEPFPQADDNATVLLGEFEGVRVLLLSDLGAAGQNDLLNRNPTLKADVIVTGMPQSSEPVAAMFLEAVQPQLVVLSDTVFPAHRRAGRLLRRRLLHARIPVVYTSDHGAVTMSFGHGRWKLETLDGTRLEGRGTGGHDRPPQPALFSPSSWRQSPTRVAPAG